MLLQKKSRTDMPPLLLLPLLLLNRIIPTHSFSPILLPIRLSKSTLWGGVGVAKDYEWCEDQYEIELKVPVPLTTTAEDINFVAKSKSIHLSVIREKDSGREKEEVLLDGKREFRGRIDTDGTFWTISDVDDGDVNFSSNEKKNRVIVITMEKDIVEPEDEFQIVEYDWGGIYPNDGKELLSKKYKEAEKIDVREYAASLGVDIDDINMTMVDKTMFTSGINMTQDMMQELTEKGYAKEVTVQNDGKEFISELGSDEEVPFKSLGGDIGLDEIGDLNYGRRGTSIPFLDTQSPWQTAVPVEEARGLEGKNLFSNETNLSEKSPKTLEEEDEVKEKDPIDALTVVKLKDILRKENLPLQGKKQELRERLKNHVQKMVQKKKIERNKV